MTTREGGCPMSQDPHPDDPPVEPGHLPNSETTGESAASSWFGLRPSVVIWAAFGLTFLSSFLPWLTVSHLPFSEMRDYSLAGTRVDGRITAVLTALAAILFGFAKVNSSAMKRRVVIASLFVMLPAVFYYVHDCLKFAGYSGPEDTFFGQVTVSLGIGLVLGVIGSLLTIFALALLLVDRSRTTRSAEVGGVTRR